MLWLCYLSLLPQQVRPYLSPSALRRLPTSKKPPLHQQARIATGWLHVAGNNKESNPNDQEKNAKLKGRQSLSSRDKALSALSKPNSKRRNARDKSSRSDRSTSGRSNLFFPSLNRTAASSPPPGSTVDSLLPPLLPDDEGGGGTVGTSGKKSKRAKMQSTKKFLHANSNSTNSSTNSAKTQKGRQSKQPQHSMEGAASNKEGYPSLLPPPLRRVGDKETNADEMRSLSSWEQFLGARPLPLDTSQRQESCAVNDNQSRGGSSESSDGSASSLSTSAPPPMSRLPSISDLFPPELSTAAGASSRLKPSSSRNQTQVVSNTDVSSLFPPLRNPPLAEETSASTSRTSSFSTKATSIDSHSTPTAPQTMTSSSYTGSKQQSLNEVLPVSDLFFRSSSSQLEDGDDDDDDDEWDDEELPFSMEQSDQISTDHNKVKIRRNQALQEQSRPLQARSTNNYRSSNTRQQSSTQPSGRRKMVRRGMEMLVGGVPINADPPQRSFELWYDSSMCDATEGKDWHKVISLNTREFGPMLHTGSVELLTELELGLFCEHFVHATMKWDVCPKDLRDIVKQYYQDHQSNQNAKEITGEAPQSPSTTRVSSNGNVDSPPGDKKQDVENVVSDADDSIVTYRGELFFIFDIPLAELSAVDTNGEVILSQMVQQTYSNFVQDGVENGAWGQFNVTLLDVWLTELKGGRTRMDGGLVLTPDESNQIDENLLDQEVQNIHQAVDRASENGYLRAAMARQAKAEHRWSPEFRNRMAEEIMSEKTVRNHREKPKAQQGAKGFGQNRIGKGKDKKGKPRKQQKNKRDEDFRLMKLNGELSFSLGISQAEIELGEFSSNCNDENEGKPGLLILDRVLRRGIRTAIEKELQEWGVIIDVTTTALLLNEADDGRTLIQAAFEMAPKKLFRFSDGSDLRKVGQRAKLALSKAMDDGEVQMATAAAAREEDGWPKDFRDRIVEELLFEEDEEDRGIWESDDEDSGLDAPSQVPDATLMLSDVPFSGVKPTSTANQPTRDNDIEDEPDDAYDQDGPFGMTGGLAYSNDDVFLNGGNDGVFWDYSAANTANAPFKGELGQKLLEAVIQRCAKRAPRVIAIGDVHGCVDELQDLLRQCDFQPGDAIVFLGDLVSKGPDSISVVQMARQIGAIGIRGNHDFEVIRWHQAIKSGMDAPVVGSEHFHVASCLTKADVKWMYSLPWYINSKELGALFVHAGFVSGIRLAKQNPRLMMNMRSILPDGTVTSKFFNNWPWARLWDGPQTVLFGHDADRGLQQYEHAIGLDTGCVYGGRLTACILPEKRLVSVSARREYFKYRRKHYD